MILVKISLYQLLCIYMKGMDICEVFLYKVFDL